MPTFCCVSTYRCASIANKIRLQIAYDRIYEPYGLRRRLVERLRPARLAPLGRSRRHLDRSRLPQLRRRRPRLRRDQERPPDRPRPPWRRGPPDDAPADDLRRLQGLSGDHRLEASARHQLRRGRRLRHFHGRDARRAADVRAQAGRAGQACDRRKPPTGTSPRAVARYGLVRENQRRILRCPLLRPGGHRRCD